MIVQFNYVTPVPEPSMSMLTGLMVLAGLAYRSLSRRLVKAAA